MGNINLNDKNFIASSVENPNFMIMKALQKKFLASLGTDIIKNLSPEDLNYLKEIAQKNQITQSDIEKLREIKESNLLLKALLKTEDQSLTPETPIPPIQEELVTGKQIFLHQLTKLPSLCLNHMIDPLYEHLIKAFTKERIYRERKDVKKIKFFRENLIKSLKKNQNIINVFLGPLLTENDGIDLNSSFSDTKELFFKVIFHKENEFLKFVNFIGFNKKNYYYSKKTSPLENNSKFRNKRFLLILNSEEKLIDNKIYLGIKIFENGKLFAGKFDEEGKLNGRGIYIDKKGNVFLCEFLNSDIESALIYGSDNTIYKGRVFNFRKQGVAQCENSEIYEFIGDFDKGKKIKGIYYPKSSNAFILDKRNESQNNFCVKSIEIDEENFRSLKKTVLAAKIDYNAKYLIKSYYDDVLLAYYGRVINKKLNEKCIIYFDNKKKYPSFEGDFQDNKRIYGKYSWSDKEFYQGKFRDNLFHNKAEKFWNSKEEQKSIVRAYGKEFVIMCDKGRATHLMQIRKIAN